MHLVASQYFTGTATYRKRYLHNIKQLKMAIKRHVLMVLMSCLVRSYVLLCCTVHCCVPPSVSAAPCSSDWDEAPPSNREITITVPAARPLLLLLENLQLLEFRRISVLQHPSTGSKCLLHLRSVCY